VVEKGGYGTSVTPVSQFYWQQAYSNVIFGPWKQIAPGYGRMVLGYFGRTPVDPDPEIVALASEKLSLEPTRENPLDIADRDEKKSIEYWKSVLEEEGLEQSEENIFIAASCDKKGIAYLKGESPLMVRKNETAGAETPAAVAQKSSGSGDMAGNYTVYVDGNRYEVRVEENGEMSVSPGDSAGQSRASSSGESLTAPTEQKSVVDTPQTGTEVISQTPGTVWKIVKSVGDDVRDGDVIMILEAMKMEIEIAAPVSGTLLSVEVSLNDSVSDGQVLARIG